MSRLFTPLFTPVYHHMVTTTTRGLRTLKLNILRYKVLTYMRTSRPTGTALSGQAHDGELQLSSTAAPARAAQHQHTGRQHSTS